MDDREPIMNDKNGYNWLDVGDEHEPEDYYEDPDEPPVGFHLWVEVSLIQLKDRYFWDMSHGDAQWEAEDLCPCLPQSFGADGIDEQAAFLLVLGELKGELNESIPILAISLIYEHIGITGDLFYFL